MSEKYEIDTITKDELMGFLKFLRSKDEIFVDKYITRHGMFYSTVDRTEYVKSLVEVIKKAESDDDAYRNLAIKMDYVNSEKKLFPEICYHEDFYEHLLGLGFSKADAEELTVTVRCGNYKRLCKRNPKTEYLTGETHKFAMACKSMPSRLPLTKMLHTEYENFIKQI